MSRMLEMQCELCEGPGGEPSPASCEESGRPLCPACRKTLRTLERLEAQGLVRRALAR